MTRQFMRFHNPRGALAAIFGGLALALTLMFIMTPEAPAQTAACQTHDSLAKQLAERYAEKPVAAGLDAGGRLIVLFASADSASWTMVAMTPAGESCVMAVGEHWQEIKRPAIDGPAA